MAERIVASSSRLYFKPLADGAGHWTVRLDVADGVVLSLVQMDDEPRTAVLASLLALVMVGIEQVIGNRLLDVEHLPRQEAVINVVSRKALEAQLGQAVGQLGEMPDGFAVSQSTDFVRSEQPPIVVVRGGEFPTAWRPREEELSDLHMLVGQLLRALIPHLLGRAVEPEVLFPKILATVREMGYRGASSWADVRG